MNANQYQSLSTEREEIMSIFSDLRPAKFYPVPDVEAMPRQTHVQNSEDIVARTDRTTQPGYISDADILGLDLYVKPPEPVNVASSYQTMWVRHSGPQWPWSTPHLTSRWC
ncbi:unnamed protein product [Macrosiphum euphorbiae]|uniref:Uncharacterized protein n=1 Tax=Macrosiphum euphorbiae TaxID=13131 RepID=A0AAV0XH06_9HEMI|nr:unnamed protein product [Macrosiphum euphorbiae]